MFSSKTANNLAFVSRQLANLADKSSIDDSLQTLANASPAEYEADIEYFKALLSGTDGPRPKLGPNPFEAIATLLPPADKDRNTFLRQFVDYVQHSRILFDTYWAGVVGLIWYLAAVTILALIIGFTFSASVAPAFSDAFQNLGGELPELTKTIFRFGESGLPVFALVLGITGALVVYLVWLFHRRIQQMAPLPRWPRWAPVLGRIAETYNLGLFLNYVRILRKSGVDANEAVATAARTSNQSADLSMDALSQVSLSTGQNVALTELGIATSIGNLDTELEHQCEQHVSQLTLALVEARDRFSLALKILLYTFVMAMVIAMYLPIFRLGSVI
ncbi:MAG: hypothetical protein AAF351_13325 [Pseudomonadota bacterium]